jgi:cytochrome c oxidase assembly protein subunit 15
MTSFGTQASVTWIRRLALAGLLLCFVVVVLGAYVRLTAAGLGCPDWPGCYGHFTPLGAAENAASQAAYPNTPLHVGKAWREMVHRYAASTLGLIIVVITALAISTRKQREVSLPLAVSLLITVVIQGMLGMLTVTWQLKPLIVTLHLVFGLTTLGMLWWLFLSLRGSGRGGGIRFVGASSLSSSAYPDRSSPPHRVMLVALIVLGIQIALGGWTSSNYAAVACPDFPKCQNSWWPETDYDDAFVLWRGLGVNYEGGVLNHPARVAIHFTHRLGAIAATLALLWAVVATLRRRARTFSRVAAYAVLGALALQIFIGASMVLKGFPLALATAHNAGAALLLLASLALYRASR